MNESLKEMSVRINKCIEVMNETESPGPCDCILGLERGEFGEWLFLLSSTKTPQILKWAPQIGR